MAETIEAFGDRFLAWDATTGALSVLTAEELVAFRLLRDGAGEAAPAEHFYRQLGYTPEESGRRCRRLAARLEREGWGRQVPPDPPAPPLRGVYLAVTRICNLSCPYCYQGAPEAGTLMTLPAAEACISRIRAANPRCHVVVSGGEPLCHPLLFDILDRLAAAGLRFSLITNGVLLDDAAIERLAGYDGLVGVQVSIDGLTEPVHALTRGHGFAQTVAAIRRLASRRVSFVLAPTIHEGNLHEIAALAAFATELGGGLKPNGLRDLFGRREVRLRPEKLLEAIELLDSLPRGSVNANLLSDEPHEDPRDRSSLAATRSQVCCGIARATANIDWDGSVYPCHLLRVAALRLGSLLEESFATILARADERGLRVPSYRIPRCSACRFVATCGGGCRAHAYHAYGDPGREDPFCEVLYYLETARLRASHGMRA